MTKNITGIFYDANGAIRAIDELQTLGYDRSQVSVLAEGDAGALEAEKHSSHRAVAGAGTGAMYGGALGAVVAGIAAAGTLGATAGMAAPIIAGPLVAILAGAGAGGLTGGMVGALVGAGIPEEQAEHYAAELKRGGILISVSPRAGDEPKVRAVLENSKAAN